MAKNRDGAVTLLLCNHWPRPTRMRATPQAALSLGHRGHMSLACEERREAGPHLAVPERSPGSHPGPSPPVCLSSGPLPHSLPG